MDGMSESQVLARSLHDVGLAAWFGGSLMGAVGLNESGARAADGEEARVAGEGWATWTPVNLAAIAAHLAGGAMLTAGNKGRIAGQKGVAATSALKTALTLAALGATGVARVIGQRVISQPEAPARAGTEPSPGTPPDVAAAQRQLRALQWAIPFLTGSMLVVNAVMGEQQRPTNVVTGVIDRLNPLK